MYKEYFKTLELRLKLGESLFLEVEGGLVRGDAEGKLLMLRRVHVFRGKILKIQLNLWTIHRIQ